MTYVPPGLVTLAGSHTGAGRTLTTVRFGSAMSPDDRSRQVGVTVVRPAADLGAARVVTNVVNSVRRSG